MSDFACACCGVSSDETSGVYFCDDCDNEEYSEEYMALNKNLKDQLTTANKRIEVLESYFNDCFSLWIRSDLTHDETYLKQQEIIKQALAKSEELKNGPA